MASRSPARLPHYGPSGVMMCMVVAPRGASLGCRATRPASRSAWPAHGLPMAGSPSFDTAAMKSAEAFVRELAWAAWVAGHAFERNIVSGFDIDEFGIARAELAQVLAYRSGIALFVEETLPLLIGRPPAVAAVIPACYSTIDSRSKRNAIHLLLMPENTLTFSKRNPW